MAAKAVIVAAATAAGWAAAPEQPGPGWVADVLAVRGQNRVALEVQWSRQSRERYEERQNAYDAAGVRAAWFVRHELPTFVADRALPAFRIERVEDGFTVLVDNTVIGLADAVVALLSGRLQHRKQVGGAAELLVVLWPVPCWDCRLPLIVWDASVTVTGPCGRIATEAAGAMWSDHRLEAYPAARRLAEQVAREHALPELARLGSRYTKTTDRRYQAFSCPRCGKVSGDFPLRQEIMNLSIYGHDPVSGFVPFPDSPAQVAGSHWCLDTGGGHCPAP